ncbi:MAG: transcriptional regulator [Flavobacteriales bacterium]|nr:transcriptional regulator [Flavobacteriales bacterium]
MPFTPLDPVLHSQLRLAIVSLLMGIDSAEFAYLKSETEATQGNLSVQLKKLSGAGYIEIKKTFKNNYPNTTVKLTKKGRKAFEAYVKDISAYLGK